MILLVRKGWLALAAGIAATVAFGVTVPNATATANVTAIPTTKASEAEPWPTRGAGIDNRFWNQQETSIDAESISTLRERFTADVGYLADEPIVADGKLFVSIEHGVSAYDPETGDLLWTYDRIDQSSLVWLDGILYACSGLLGEPSRLHALTPDGKQLWSYQTSDVTFDGQVVAGNRIAVSGGSRDYAVNQVLAFDRDGKQVWSKPGFTIAEYFSTVVDSSGQIFLRPWRNNGAVDRMVAIDLETGRENWSIDKALQARAAVPESESVVAVKEDLGIADEMALLDSRTGSPRWEIAAQGSATHSNAVDDEHVYFHDNIGEALVARDLETGKQAWRVPLAPADDAYAPVVAGGLVYLVSAVGDDYRLIAYRADNGEQVWRLPLTESAYTPVIANGWLYLVDGDKLRAYSLEQPSREWPSGEQPSGQG